MLPKVLKTNRSLRQSKHDRAAAKKMGRQIWRTRRFLKRKDAQDMLNKDMEKQKEKPEDEEQRGLKYKAKDCVAARMAEDWNQEQSCDRSPCWTWMKATCLDDEQWYRVYDETSLENGLELMRPRLLVSRLRQWTKRESARTLAVMC